MTLNYHVIVERHPFPNEMVGGFDSRYEISSLLDGKQN
jgi:hypothetical protein